MPRIQDDGRTVTVDLHGLTVQEAESWIRRIVARSFEYGRSRVELIHGTSTSSLLYRNRTIKHAVHQLLDAGSLNRYVASDWRDEGRTLLSLRSSGRNRPERLHIRDFS